MRRIPFWVFNCLLLASLACSFLNSAPNPTAPAVTAAPQETVEGPEATRDPGATDLPDPTPTPDNYYVHPSAGFALTLPDSWEVAEEQGRQVSFFDERSRLLFLGFDLGATGEEENFETITELFVTEFLGDDFADVEPQAASDLTLGADIPAQQRDITATTDDTEVLFRLVYTTQNHHSYIFVALATPEALADEADTLKEVFASMQFVSVIFGYERDEVLLMAGGDPEPEELDPAATTGSAGEYVGLLFSGLVRLSPSLQVEPDLADTWEISPDGTVYTFTLRPDLTFASGDPLTAEDIKYSWERAADPATNSNTAGTYLGDVLGLKAKLAGEAEEIAGLEVVDDLTLRVTLDGSKPYFLAKITYPTAFVVNQANVEKDPEDWMFAPDASGPFVLERYTELEVMIFERNARYHTPPALKAAIFQLALAGSTISLFEGGDMDITGLSSDDALLVREADHPLHESWRTTTSLCTTLFQIDPAQAPMDDINVRRALAQSLNREALIERFSAGLDLPATAILPPSLPGASPEAQALPYDPEAARAALAASKYAGNLPEITITASGLAGEPSEFLNAIIDMWQTELGAEIKVELVEPGKITEQARSQHGHIVSYGWCADYPDPENFLDVLYHTDSDFNVATYSNPEVDALLEQARTEADPAARMALYTQIEKALLDDVATIPLLNSVSDGLVNPRVQNYVMAPMGVPIMHRLSIVGGE